MTSNLSDIENDLHDTMLVLDSEFLSLKSNLDISLSKLKHAIITTESTTMSRLENAHIPECAEKRRIYVKLAHLTSRLDRVEMLESFLSDVFVKGVTAVSTDPAYDICSSPNTPLIPHLALTDKSSYPSPNDKPERLQKSPLSSPSLSLLSQKQSKQHKPNGDFHQPHLPTSEKMQSPQSPSHDTNHNQHVTTPPPTVLSVGQGVWYLSNGQMPERAVVSAVHKDDFPNIYYTISILSNGIEKQTILNRLVVIND